jgi:pimeloyl-ACP methyl ester carboxylesterase
MSKTIVFIHGAWLTPSSWNLFKESYEQRGYTCLAPAWPPDLGRVGIAAIVSRYADIIRSCPEPPILMGHSFGGLFVQLLLDRGLGAAGVAINPAPVRGVLPGRNALRAALPVFLTLAGWAKTIRMSFAAFQRDFANTLSEAAQREAYERYIVPTPGRIYFENALGIASGVNFANPARPPLLLTAGLSDRTIEPDMVHATYHRQIQSPSVTALKEFHNRPHLLIASPGWRQVADYCIEWAERYRRPNDRAVRANNAAFA